MDQDENSIFDLFNSDPLKGWLLPRHIASSLKVLVFGGKIQVVSFTRFISNFCPCPDDFLELDVSGFPNLNRLHYDLGYLEDNVNAFCRVLSQNDTSRLKHIVCIIRLEELGDLSDNAVAPLDNLLCSDKFRELECLEVTYRRYQLPRKSSKQASRPFREFSNAGY